MGPRAPLTHRRGGRGTHLVAIAVAALSVAACRHATRSCSPALAASVEVRDAAGAIELALRPPPPDGKAPSDPRSRDVCDGSDHLLARLIDRGARGQALDNAAGDPMARVEPATENGGDATLSLFDPRGGHHGGPFRMHDQDDLLRFLDPIGVPVAQISRSDGRALALDPAGTPFATVEAVDQRLVVRARDGAVRSYVIGVSDERAAAAFALDALPLTARLAVARFLDRR